MNRPMSSIPAVLLWLGALAVPACSDSTDVTDIADELADVLADDLAFEGETTESGPPPAGHVGDAGYPQIRSINAPLVLSPGADFSVTLNLDAFTPANFGGVVIHVLEADSTDSATGFQRVPVPLVGTVVTLTGSLGTDPELLGRSFTIKLAGYRIDGEVGNYAYWNFMVGTETGALPRHFVTPQPATMAGPWPLEEGVQLIDDPELPCGWPDAEEVSGWVSLAEGGMNPNMQILTVLDASYPNGTRFLWDTERNDSLCAVTLLGPGASLR